MNTINVLSYLDKAAERTPDKTAFTDGARSLSFADLRNRARSIGSFLAGKGHRAEPVFVLMSRSPDMVAAMFGTVYAGCAYVPADPEMAKNRIQAILSELSPRALICDEASRSFLESLSYGGALYDYADICHTPAEEGLLEEIRAQAIDTDLLYIVYTSGSTGAPKGVAACHRSVIDYVENLSVVLGVDGDTVFGSQTPLYVDACLKELYPTLMACAATVLIPKELFMFPLRLLDFLREHRINTLCWVVSALTILSGTGALEKAPPRQLRTVAFGSELFPLPQLARWRAALPDSRFINLYGPTECTGMSCWYELKGELPPGEALPIGKPFPNTRILLLDGDTLVTEPEREGEICILGTCVTLGYYGDADKTRASFVQNPLNPFTPERMYRTGDRGKYSRDGELVFCARQDQQIKHMGHRIELGELENAAAGCAGVVRAACVHTKENGKLTLFYQGTAASKELMLYLRDALPRFMCPSAIVPLDSLPLTPNGKLDRQALHTLANTKK